ncbi:MAG: CoA ester lyase [Pseudolabrys sp.]|nr:CoA ester lyase [Pseudolabrys sp.]
MKPVRVALFAPGINARVMSKAIGAEVDAVIFDLEDSVPIAAKAEARSLVSAAIEVQAATTSGPAVYVRSNGAATGQLAGDLEAVVRSGLDAVILPKVESVEEVQQTAAAIDRHEASRKMNPGSVAIILQIESALGVYRCFDLIKASPRVAATCFGSARDGDLQTDLGCAWSIEGTELIYARSKVLLETRAAGGKVFPLDGVFSDLNDEAGLIEDSRLSARLGFVGRTVIHPKQIAPVRAAYAVSAAEVHAYGKVVGEFEAAEKKGVAAIVVDGKLVDYAMYQRAKRVLALAKLDGP